MGETYRTVEISPPSLRETLYDWGDFPTVRISALIKKAAIIGMTRSFAAYYASRGIRFNALLPALVDTPMAERAVNDAETMWRLAEMFRPEFFTR